MSQDTPKDQVGLTRYGKVVYETNPSITGCFPVRLRPNPSKKLGNAYMVAPGSGEIIAQGAFAFIEEHEVDEAQFVKIYLAGVKQYGQPSKSGALLFEFVYREISGGKGKDKDTVALNYLLALRWMPDLHKRTYERGMNELLDKGFLFRSLVTDVYFVNIRFMFNGNRLDTVRRYRIKNPAIPRQPDLFDPAPSATHESPAPHSRDENNNGENRPPYPP